MFFRRKKREPVRFAQPRAMRVSRQTELSPADRRVVKALAPDALRCMKAEIFGPAEARRDVYRPEAAPMSLALLRLCVGIAAISAATLAISTIAMLRRR